MPKQNFTMIGESWSEINCPTVHQNTFRENGVERSLSVTALVIQTASSSHPTSSSEIACLPARAAHNCLSNTFASYHSYFIVKLSLQFSIEHSLYSSSAATVGHLVVVSENKYGVALHEPRVTTHQVLDLSRCSNGPITFLGCLQAS